MRRDLIAYLEQRSEPVPESGCWVWLRHVDIDGYGKCRLRVDGSFVYTAHRVGYLAAHDRVPEGAEIDHVCNVRSCVNPAHLRALPHAENVRRADHVTNHRNRVKTHCHRGHELSGHNVVLERSNGRTARKCRACRLASAKPRARKRYAQLSKDPEFRRRHAEKARARRSRLRDEARS